MDQPKGRAGKPIDLQGYQAEDGGLDDFVPRVFGQCGAVVDRPVVSSGDRGEANSRGNRERKWNARSFRRHVPVTRVSQCGTSIRAASTPGGGSAGPGR